jgi:tRNA A37 threonylcarbamoyltransferase TsaD
MIQLFQNSFIDGFFNNNTIQQPKVEKIKIPEPKVKVDGYPFSFFGMKKQNSVRSIKTAPVLNREPKSQKDMSYYPHSGMGLFFV